MAEFKDKTENGLFELLSLNVKKLYISATTTPENYLDLEEMKTFIDFNDFTFIEKNLESTLNLFLLESASELNSQILSSEKLKLKDADFYSAVLTVLSPFFHMCHLAMTSRIKNSTEKTLEYDSVLDSNDYVCDELFSWVSEIRVIKDCIDEIRNHTFYTISEENENKYVKTLAYKTTELKVNAVSALLLLTPVLEKSLGDALAAYSFLPGTSNIKVPALLRDLILNETLQEIVDSKVIVFLLHVLLGTPRSLNLRNIVWHGFSSISDDAEDSGEISVIFASTLLMIIRNLGKRFQSLKERAVIPSPMQLRKNISLIKRMEKIYTNFDVTKMSHMCKKFEKELTQYCNNSSPESIYSKLMLKKKPIIEVI